MREVLISIQPKWCELIANGKKTVEVRKTKPKIDTPFKCYIYCTSVDRINLEEYARIHLATCGRIDEWHGKVIGEFVCNKIEGGYLVYPWSNYLVNASCLSYDEIEIYGGTKPLYCWHISDLVIYDQPKELSEFRKYNPFFEGISTEELEAEGVSGVRIKRPPQSWWYVEGAMQNER